MTPVLDPESAHLVALQRLADFHGRRVLELGAATVGIARDASHVLAFDPDLEAIERARRSLPSELAERICYRVASAREIEVEPHSFEEALPTLRTLARGCSVRERCRLRRLQVRPPDAAPPTQGIRNAPVIPHR